MLDLWGWGSVLALTFILLLTFIFYVRPINAHTFIMRLFCHCLPGQGCGRPADAVDKDISNNSQAERQALADEDLM